MNTIILNADIRQVMAFTCNIVVFSIVYVFLLSK